MYAELSEKKLKDLRVALVHGRQKSAEKDEILEQFRRGEWDVLVSTTVIEVGVNVPNATRDGHRKRGTLRAGATASAPGPGGPGKF